MPLGRRPLPKGALSGAVLAVAGGARAAAAPSPRRHVIGDAPRPPERSTVGVVRPAAFGTLREAVAEAVRLAGGLSFVRPGFVAASSDPLALDAIGIAFLRLEWANDAIGRGSIWRIPVLRRAAEIGVGVGEVGRIRITGIEPGLEARLRGQLA